MRNEHENNNIHKLQVKPKVIPRSEHRISRSEISDAALKVLYRLKNAGYQAYLVGGAVRDLLLGMHPKDFDVVTDAHPEQIRELFRNCRLIGRRFRLAHVRFGNEIIEVSTFRAPHHVSDIGGESEDGRIIRDNVYGTIDDDVWRRDFTVNALFYNIKDFSIVDYVGGVRDIEAKQMRLIGVPEERYREDAVRMLRAVRFAAKLGFSISKTAECPFEEMAGLIQDIPPARLYEEFNKLFMAGNAFKTFEMLEQYHLFARLFPEAARHFATNKRARALFCSALKNTDQRIQENLPVTPAFVIAALLWSPVRKVVEDYMANDMAEYEAIHLASDAVLSRQVKTVSMPRRVTMISREVWLLQSRLKNRHGKRALRLLAHQRFRAAYDFLELRAGSGEPVSDLAEWWKEFQQQHPEALFKKQKDIYRQTKDKRRRYRSRSKHKN